MYMHNERLMYTVRVSEPNPRLAGMLLEQFGGPQGELAAAMRYFTQGLAEADPKRKDMLMDIATEELSHLEVIGNIVVMLNKGVKARVAEGMDVGTLLSEISGGSVSEAEAILYGGGPSLTNSAGAPWTAAYIDTIGDPTCDLRSNIAAEARAKIIYERLIGVTDDSGIKDALGFLMTREIAHQKAFEKALYSIEENFPPGKQPGVREFTDKYYDMSQGPQSQRGPWNKGDQWEYESDLEKMAPVDDGDGMASVKLDSKGQKLYQQMAARTASSDKEDKTASLH